MKNFEDKGVWYHELLLQILQVDLGTLWDPDYQHAQDSGSLFGCVFEEKAGGFLPDQDLSPRTGEGRL